MGTKVPAKGWVSFLAVCLAGLAVLYQVEVEQDRWVASQVITLKASAGDAYRFVTTSEYMSKWLPFVSSVLEADGKQMSVGKQYRATYEFPLLGEFHTSYHVVEYVPLRKVAVESESWLRPRLELRFESSGDAQCRMHVLYTLGPVLHFVSNQQLQRSLFLLRMVFPQ
ncbi:uncharacterized protein LOC119441519 [Dermacentor silvarum]|uniref:uncharacterized protein LOC119441519 n=1 Tax=Dermacentor silvarum TaxID=543639 RepID=UPI002101C42F|nr:uncharacterized protein LOC119441519 [Dermacentor silvarum]